MHPHPPNRKRRVSQWEAGAINVLERAFRAQNLTSAVKKELNLVRRNNMVGEHLLKELVRIYQQHNIRDWVDRQRIEQEKPVPRIICSEALV